jgi:hypothetical protein
VRGGIGPLEDSIMKTDTTLSRRRLLAGVPAVAAVGVPSVATALGGLAAGDDAKLLALAPELEAVDAEYARVCAAPDAEWDAWEAANPHVDLGDDKGDPQAYFMDLACDRGHAVLNAIWDCRPSTMRGLAVMARAAQLEIEWWHTGLDGYCEHEVEIQFDLAEAILSMRKA